MNDFDEHKILKKLYAIEKYIETRTFEVEEVEDLYGSNLWFSFVNKGVQSIMKLNEADHNDDSDE
jgi:hypothetical protein